MIRVDDDECGPRQLRRVRQTKVEKSVLERRARDVADEGDWKLEAVHVAGTDEEGLQADHFVPLRAQRFQSVQEALNWEIKPESCWEEPKNPMGAWLG